MHPLINDLSFLTDNEIEEKILKLNKAYHISQNEEVRHQIILTLDTYKIELQERQTKKKIEENKRQDENDLDNLINVS